jgi:hypothetical protein
MAAYGRRFTIAAAHHVGDGITAEAAPLRWGGAFPSSATAHSWKRQVAMPI